MRALCGATWERPTRSAVPLRELIGAALGYTVRLATGALLLAMALGLVTGVLAAAFHNRWVDRVLMTLAVAGISAPAFWMAVVLQLVFALGLRWFPLSGVTKPLAFVLPTVALGVWQAASIARVTRTSLLDVLRQDYMTTAVAKGASRARVVLGHGLKNALVPIITIVGTQFGDVFAGSVLVETIFGIPGVGSLLLTAVNQRDLPLIEGGVMYVAAMFVPPLLPYAPDVQELSQRLAAPSSAHLLGTDELGRDILTRLVYGCRISLSVGLASQAMALVCGFVLGACAGYVGGRVDAVVSFVIQVFSSFPFLLFSLVVMYALAPGLAIIATVMAFNLFGDALRDALDPRLR